MKKYYFFTILLFVSPILAMEQAKERVKIREEFKVVKNASYAVCKGNKFAYYYTHDGTLLERYLFFSADSKYLKYIDQNARYPQPTDYQIVTYLQSGKREINFKDRHNNVIKSFWLDEVLTGEYIVCVSETEKYSLKDVLKCAKPLKLDLSLITLKEK